MRLLVATVFLEGALALALAPNPNVLWLGLVASALAVYRIRQEAGVITPLLFALSVVPLMLDVFLSRLFGVVAIVALILFALSDIENRHRGAPLSFARLLLWYLSGVFVLLVGVFAAAADHVASPATLLSVVLLLTGGAGWVARRSAARARGMEAMGAPVFMDAVAIALIATEMIVALTFLPLNPIPLASLGVIALWFLVHTVVSIRHNTFGMLRMIRFSANAVFLSLVVVLSTLLI